MVVVTTQSNEADCSLCTEPAQVRCHNCQQPACVFHTSNVTSRLGAAGNVVTFEKSTYCTTCAELHELVTKECKITCEDRAKLGCSSLLIYTIIFIPLIFVIRKSVIRGRCETAKKNLAIKLREYNASVSPAVVIRISTRMPDQTEYVGFIFPHSHANYAASQRGESDERAALLPR